MSTDLQTINQAKAELRETETFQDLCREYEVEPDVIDHIPVKFDDNLDVSARTEKGIISLNGRFRGNVSECAEYLAHEITHTFQQCFGDKPTQGSSNSDDYLANPYEQEGFQAQTSYISETEGDEEASDYVDQVLDHHEQTGEQRKKNRSKLLRLAARTPQLLLPFDTESEFENIKLSPEQIARNCYQSEKLLALLENQPDADFKPKRKRKSLRQLMLELSE